MPEPNTTCRYSKCNKPYHACAESVRVGHYKSCGCCYEHYCMYQNEVAFFRGQPLPFPEKQITNQMFADGTLPTPKEKAKTYLKENKTAEKTE